MKRGQSGMSLVEIMVGLSITALMMLTIFRAIDTSFVSFRTNQSQGMLALKSRMVLMHMLDHIRASALHQPQDSVKKTAWQNSAAPVDDTGIKLAELQNDEVTWVYYTYWLDTSNSANPQLKMTRVINGASTTTVLLNQVTSFNVRMWSGKSDPAMTQNDILVRAAISLTTREQNKGLSTGRRITGSNAVADSLSVAGSTVPRQNAWTGTRLAYSINTLLSRSN